MPSMLRAIWVTSICCVVAACGPSSRKNTCTGADCNSGSCSSGETRDCYDGAMMTENIGPCHGGMQTCTAAGVWGSCLGEVVPVAEDCTNGVDDNCNVMTDEDIDSDGDGYTTCAGHDCCDSTECSNPSEVNPGAFDVPGDQDQIPLLGCQPAHEGGPEPGGGPGDQRAPRH